MRNRARAGKSVPIAGDAACIRMQRSRPQRPSFLQKRPKCNTTSVTCRGSVDVSDSQFRRLCSFFRPPSYSACDAEMWPQGQVLAFCGFCSLFLSLVSKVREASAGGGPANVRLSEGPAQRINRSCLQIAYRQPHKRQKVCNHYAANPCSDWCRRKESNPRPSHYE